MQSLAGFAEFASPDHVFREEEIAEALPRLAAGAGHPGPPPVGPASADEPIPLAEIYDHVEWPVVVLLGSMIPLGAALEISGGTELLASALISLTDGLPAWAILTVLMIVTMTLSDVLNNTATTIVAAPVGIQMATTLGVSPDPFLMAVAIAASAAFLTPIGHKNNTLILGPGGYGFGDYWRMGLPLEIIIVAVSIPTLLIVWPL